MRAALGLGVLMVAAPIIGCIGTDDEPEAGTDVSDPVEAFMVDPMAALEAGEPMANVQVLGDWRDGGTQEVDAWGDFLFVDQGSHVVILNVSDPANIEEVSRIPSETPIVDVKVSDDGDYVFTADQQYLSAPPKGGTGPLTGGIYVYDVSDKAAPRFVTYAGIGERRGPHMITYFQYPDGSEYVFGANADISINRFDRGAGTLETVARYSPDLVTGFDRTPERLDVLYGVLGWAHDMFVQVEPDGRVLMDVAFWDAGLRIVDVTDPSAPSEVGGWTQYGEDEEGNLHTVATQWIGQRRITIGSPEVGFAVVGGYHYLMGTDKAVIYVWDTTDPANTALLGTWVNPIKPYAGRDMVPGEGVDSTHNFQIEDGRVYLAHYALGVWILDVSTPGRQAAPEILAYYTEDAQNTWDVVVHRGATISSGVEGIVAMHYLPDTLGATGITSRA